MSDNARSDFTEPTRRAAEAMQAGSAKLAETSSAVGAKMIDQAESNAREAFAAMRAAANAKDVSEVMKIQSEYLRDQTSRGMSQAREISDLILRFGQDATAPFRSGS